jgi:hypothetical protein
LSNRPEVLPARLARVHDAFGLFAGEFLCEPHTPADLDRRITGGWMMLPVLVFDASGGNQQDVLDGANRASLSIERWGPSEIRQPLSTTFNRR